MPQQGRYVAPSVFESAFSCPHCGALANQTWYKVFVQRLREGLPAIVDPSKLDGLKFTEVKDIEERENLKRHFRKLASGIPFIDGPGQNYNDPNLHNTFVSRCFNCDEVALWLYDRMLYPEMIGISPPNTDMENEVCADYREAALILDKSPRGAAALLRLAIQKLCRQLGESGENINSDIRSLVLKGLDVRVQQALDVVRVVGNNAVHPGQIDLRDNRATAEKLFSLVNIIADIMISQPKMIAGMFDELPQSALDAIAKRDKVTD